MTSSDPKNAWFCILGFLLAPSSWDHVNDVSGNAAGGAAFIYTALPPRASRQLTCVYLSLLRGTHERRVHRPRGQGRVTSGPCLGLVSSPPPGLPGLRFLWTLFLESGKRQNLKFRWVFLKVLFLQRPAPNTRGLHRSSWGIAALWAEYLWLVTPHLLWSIPCSGKTWEALSTPPT